jgi:dipeptidyl aminopeptidase/acylaminoacyl peptidase
MAAALIHLSAAHAGPQPLEAFARMPHMRSVSISPDGSRIAFVSSVADESVAITFERQQPAATTKTLFRAEAGKFDIEWCRWANDTRLLCGLTGIDASQGHHYPTLRIIGVNADGGNLRALVSGPQPVPEEFRDRVVDWTPDKPESVLVQISEKNSAYPTVFEVNVNDGTRTVHTRDYAPIRSFASDGQGHIRLGYGMFYGHDEVAYLARLSGEDSWQKISETRPFTKVDALRPIAIGSKPNTAYALGERSGRTALLEMDLTGKSESQVVIAHPRVDVDEPLLSADGRLLGMLYQMDKRQVQYVDEKIRSAMLSVDQLRPGMLNVVVDQSADQTLLLIRSSSDAHAPNYLLLDTRANKLQEIGKAYPELSESALPRTQYVSYKAKDGTSIPAYLTLPQTEQMENLPLIVLPHDGPLARDDWEFSFLRAFLLDRGYAVLQMSYRGSPGYGDQWRLAAHQDWGGLSYSDITDGARWAVETGLANPKQVCIVGWGFGGYAALLGAAREADLYRCAVSIGGIADLNSLLMSARHEYLQAPYSGLAGGFGGDSRGLLQEVDGATNRRPLSGRQRQLAGYYTREQIGTSVDKLRRNSPVELASEVRVPVLLVHGEKDMHVDADQSRQLDQVLTKAKKPHRAVFIDGATHALDRRSDRVTLLSEIEKFLTENLRAGSSGS